MKEISIVIPCYNVEQYIDECVVSLVNQTFGIDKMELIFVDDASTDHTLEKLMVWEKQYPDSIIIISLTQNSKQGAARNVGMQYATGEYLGFVDADDWVETHMYQIMYDVYHKEDVECVVCARYEEYANGDRSISGPEEDGILDLTEHMYCNAVIGAEASGGVFQHLYKRKWLQELGVLFPENIAYEDNYFGGILNYYIKRIGKISEPLYHYRVNEASTIHKKNQLHHLDRLKIELMKLEELTNRRLYEVHKEDIEVAFLSMYFVNTIHILISRFDELPKGIIGEMQQTTKKLFPNWKRNPLLQCYTETYALCQMIDYPFQTGDKREVTIVYNYYKQQAGIQ